MAQTVSAPKDIGASMIRYDAREKIAWDIFICGVVFLCSILVPYRLLSGYDPFDAFYVFVTVVFCVDVAVVFRTTLASGRNVISDPQTVAGHYLRSWFVVDLLSALPFPMLVLLAGRDGAVPAALLPWLGGLRLVRLLSLLKVNSFFGRLPNFVNISGAALRLVVFGYWLTLVTHFIALGWLLIGAGNPEGEFFTRYLRALYWCITTISTIGYGDVLPDQDSHLQLVYTMVIQLFGVGIYGFVIGNISTLVANLDTAKSEYKAKMGEVLEFMRRRSIPAQLQAKVREYYAYLWETRGNVGEVDWLSEMPGHLSVDLAMFLNRDVIAKVPLFRDADELFLRQVVGLLKAVVFLPGDNIMREGEHADCMYFLSSGEVEVFVNSAKIANLSSGAFFGEAALVEGGWRSASVIAMGYCEGFSLSVDNFNLLRGRYPEFDKRVLEIVEKRKK